MLKWLGRVGLALLFALLFGLAIGTVLRLRMERPVTYIGEVGDSSPALLILTRRSARPAPSTLDAS